MKHILYKFQRVGIFMALLLCQHLSMAQLMVSSAHGQTPTGDQQPAERNLKEVLNELRNYYQVDILFADQMVEGFTVPARSVNLKIKLEKNLEEVLRPSGLQYKKAKDGSFLITRVASKKTADIKRLPENGVPEQVSKTGIINHLPEPSLQTSVSLVFQVQGKVSSETGEGIPGVNVLLKGTTSGTTTNSEGNYSLSIPDGNGTLVFSYIGYTTEEVPINNRATIDVSLVPDIQSLSEVVVVGYGTQKRSDITGSVSSVSKERLSNLPVTNVLQAIQGTVAGVNITQNSSVPGSPSTSINVRGARSISANNDPYIILDGVPFAGAFNDINPNDIASMEILKDASAVAIYGTRGANGVILITTKRGETGKPRIQYNTYAGPEFKSNVLKPMNGAQYIEKYSAFTRQMNLTPDIVPNYSELVNYQAGKETDWLKEVSRQGFIHDHSLSVSGGTKDVKYYVAGEYLKQEGVLKGYQFERMSVRTNLDAKVNSWLSMGTSLFFVSNNSDGGRVNLNWTMAMSPYGQLYNAKGEYELFPMKPELLFINPLLGLNSARLDRRKNFNATFYTEVQPAFLKGLKFRLNGNYAYLPSRFSSYTGRNTNDLLGTGSC
jgi:TonB-linked SusC/RagA family outer membrane protein